MRELGGEIWAELGLNFSEDEIHWEVRDAAAFLITRVLARHVGCVIVMDEDLPVEPLPKRVFEEP